jgi:hypothetical protein
MCYYYTNDVQVQEKLKPLLPLRHKSQCKKMWSCGALLVVQRSLGLLSPESSFIRPSQL